MYDMEEALMIIENFENYNDAEYKEALSVIITRIVKEVGIERDFQFR